MWKELSNLMPRGAYYLQDPGALWLNVISDGLIALSCLAILLLLVRFVRKNRDAHFRWISLACGMFLLSFGATHAVAVWMVWRPDSWLDGAVKAVCGVFALVAAALLVPLLAGLAKLPGRADLNCLDTAFGAAVESRKTAEEDLLRARAALDARTADLRFLADAMPQIVWTAAPDGALTYFNRLWYEFSGCAPGSLSWQDRTHPDDLPAAQAQWRHAMESGEALRAELRIRSHADRYSRHLLRAAARRDAESRIVQWVGTITPADEGSQPEPATAAEDVRTAAPAAVVATETVLVLENARTVLRLIHNTLADQGYRILEASSPEEARQILAERGAEIDLLLAEAVMPQASGTEFAKEASSGRPGLRVLFIASQADAPAVEQQALEAGASTIQKPFSPAALSRKIREALDGPAA